MTKTRKRPSLEEVAEALAFIHTPEESNLNSRSVAVILAAEVLALWELLNQKFDATIAKNHADKR